MMNKEKGMAKFVFSYGVGDGYTYCATEYVALEGDTKEDLITELMCTLLDFEKHYHKTQEEIKALEEKSEKARKGGHKKEPDFDEYVKLSNQRRDLEASLKFIEFKGKKYDMETFMYWEQDTIKGQPKNYPGYQIRNIENNIQTLDEWFESKR